MKMGIFAILCTSLFLVPLTQGYDNSWDGIMYKECPNGQVFRGVRGTHSNRREDRLYEWYCGYRSVFGSSHGSCFWTGYLNNFDAVLNYNCPSAYALAGAFSYHDNYREDRRFRFKCCRPSTSKQCWTESSSLTGYINYWDQYFHWTTGMFMTGAYSVHDNYREDRRWKIRKGMIRCRDPCSCPAVATSDWYVENVGYDLPQAQIAHQKPVVLTTKTIDNRYTSAKSSASFSVSESKSFSSSFSHEYGVSLTSSMSFSAGIPFIAETTFEISLGVSYKHTRTKQTTESKQFTSTFTFEVGSRALVRAEAVVQKGKIDVPYTMRLKHRRYGCTCKSGGTWRGVDFYNMRMKVVDLAKRESIPNASKQDVDDASISEKCTNGTKGWDCESNGVHFYGFDAFNFPSTNVPESPKWTAKTKAECLDSCHGEGDCAGVVRETDLGDEDAGNCYLITSDAVNDCEVPEETDDDNKKFTIWLAHGIEKSCYERPTTYQQHE